MPLQTRHKVGIITAAVIALAAGTGTQTGLVPHWEGEQHHAVRNSFDPINPATGKKVVTVCNGHTDLDDPTLQAGDYYTAAMCRDVLGHDLVKYNKDLVRYLGSNYMLSNHMHAALLSFDINVGPGNFKKIAKLLREGKREEGCRAMGRYVRAAGVTLKGLYNRRYDKFWGEIAWCLRDD